MRSRSVLRVDEKTKTKSAAAESLLELTSQFADASSVYALGAVRGGFLVREPVPHTLFGGVWVPVSTASLTEEGLTTQEAVRGAGADSVSSLLQEQQQDQFQ